VSRFFFFSTGRRKHGDGYSGKDQAHARNIKKPPRLASSRRLGKSG
jgi:hypothetical protein